MPLIMSGWTMLRVSREAVTTLWGCAEDPSGPIMSWRDESKNSLVEWIPSTVIVSLGSMPRTSCLASVVWENSRNPKECRCPKFSNHLKMLLVKSATKKAISLSGSVMVTVSAYWRSWWSSVWCICHILAVGMQSLKRWGLRQLK